MRYWSLMCVAIVLSITAFLNGAGGQETTKSKRSSSTASKSARPAPAPAPSGKLRLDPVLLTLIEQVDVPARDIGVLEKILVKESDLVKEGDLLAKVEDKDVMLAFNKAKLEAQMAREDARNDTKVRAAKKAVEIAQLELKRATDSVQAYSKSVAPAEVDRLKLVVDKAKLDVEQVEQEHRNAQLTLQLKENEQSLAEHNVARRQVLAPIAGIVVAVNRHLGEWVQPGEKVFRLLRINKLRAETFLSRHDLEMHGNLQSRPVTLTVTVGSKPRDFPGRIVFVHPEVNPQTAQVRIWAEFDNPDLVLRPGMQGSMTIEPATPEVATKPK